MEMVRYERTFVKIIRKGQLKYCGYINRAHGKKNKYWVARFLVPNAEEDYTDGLNN